MKKHHYKIGSLHLVSIAIGSSCLVYGLSVGISRDFETWILLVILAWATIAFGLTEAVLRLWPSSKEDKDRVPETHQ